MRSLTRGSTLSPCFHDMPPVPCNTRLYTFQELTHEIHIGSLMGIRSLPGSQLLPLSSQQSRGHRTFLLSDVSISFAWVSSPRYSSHLRRSPLTLIDGVVSQLNPDLSPAFYSECPQLGQQCAKAVMYLRGGLPARENFHPQLPSNVSSNTCPAWVRETNLLQPVLVYSMLIRLKGITLVERPWKLIFGSSFKS